MKYSLALALIFFAVVTAVGQSEKEPKTDFTKMYLPVWIEARDHCMDVARAMPEEKYAYRPTEVSKSFGEQMVHIAHTIPLLTKRYVQGMDVKPNTPDASEMSKPNICSGHATPVGWN